MLIAKFDSADVNENLEEYEDIIGKKLPDQLREFIVKYNGGETPNTSFKTGSISSDLKVLYGVGNVRYSLNSVKPIEYNGVSYLTIGCDSFGNDVLIDMISETISFMNHESGKITKIADNFKSFINICESKGVNSASTKSVEEREADLIKRGRCNIITNELRDMWKAEIAKYSSLHLEEVSL